MLESPTLIQQLLEARWFGGKGHSIQSAEVIDRAQYADAGSAWLVHITYADAPADTYVLVERINDPPVARDLLQRFHGMRVETEGGGALIFTPTHLLGQVPRDRIEPIELMRGEQSNTSVRFGDVLILKLFRRLQFGPNPEVEIGRFLTEHSNFRGFPPLVGSLEYLSPEDQSASLALLQRFQPNRGDAWRTTLERLARVLEGDDPRPSIESLARLGRTTAELHIALAQPTADADFAPEPITPADTDAWFRAIRDELRLATRPASTAH